MKYLLGDAPPSLFDSSAYLERAIITPSGQTIDLSSLSPLLRVLLSTDGTVTKSLEAIFWEPVQVRLVSQGNVQVARDINLFERNVQLVGLHSSVKYAYARSFMNEAVMPSSLMEALHHGVHGVGWLLRQMSAEQYRAVVEIGYTHELPINEQPKGFGESIYRTYCIVVGGQRLMQITEHFPLALFL
ncbi:chorismate--pyruvate lyase family protein [Halioxenophilus sp. WMMB6]|uniref:chorismate--pyruvate lyase family protein n=1 Tax=Halioxenophilus sp. WMMB6 TaxID=3073815 RepID=UPI00295E33BE|nr:chorismate pyruvate-lyase family protein [Halioxenophilus sp. WMMB6]